MFRLVAPIPNALVKKAFRPRAESDRSISRDMTENIAEAGEDIVVDFAEIFVETLHTRDFRGLGDCTIELEKDLTLLVGRNNAGKSRVLRALAIGLGAIAADRDDLTANGPDVAVIDVILAPLASADEDEETFDDRVARRLDSVQTLSDEPPRERFGWRATIHLSQEGLGVKTDFSVLLFDQVSQEWQLPKNPSTLRLEQRSLVAADLVETRRDLFEELSRRGSPIRRILDDLEIAPEQRGELEASLRGLGEQIVSASESLAAVTGALEKLTESVAGVGTPRLEPLPVRLEELARSVSIELDTGQGGLPLRFHGSGARSLTSLRVQSVLYDRRLGRDGPALRPHPVTLIEEPEAHLHPQAQFELPELLDQIRGQIVLSTHSSHLVSVVEPRTIRVLQQSENGITVVDLRPAADEEGTLPRPRRASMHVEEMEKIKRSVERPFGELLFASAVIVGDGATERALLPPLVRHVLGQRAHGVCVVDPGGIGGPYADAILKFANLLGLPWFLFCDSDPSGQLAAESLVNSRGDGDMGHVVWVRPPGDGEGDSVAATERMFLDFDRELCVAACEVLGFDGDEDSVLSFMVQKKGVTGRLLAAELVSRYPWGAKAPDDAAYWPGSLIALMDKLDGTLPDGAD